MEPTTRDSELQFAGVLDVRRTAEVRSAIYARLARTTGDLFVDLAEVESVDLTTLKMLAVANRFAERQGRRVVLRRCPSAVRRRLHLSHLRSVIPLEPEQQAITGGSSPG